MLNQIINSIHRPQEDLSKSLGVSFKNLGSSSQGTSAALQTPGQWIEQNQYIWDAIQNGTSGLSQQDIAQFTDWYKYAYQTAFGAGQNLAGNWDPNVGANGAHAPQENLPSGAKLGPQYNIVFNGEKDETTYAASSHRIDVLSDEFTLNVDQKVKSVDVEKTTDTALSPPSPVIKITVYDPSSSPDHTTYFVDADAKININTIGGKGVTQHGTEILKTEDGSPQVNVGTYEKPESNDGSETPPASIPGKKNKDGVWEYTAKGDETIDFNPQDLASDGKARFHDIYGNSNIILPGGDHAEVIDTSVMTVNSIPTPFGTFDIPVVKKGAVLVIIKDKQGKITDIYSVAKGYKVDIQANKEYVSFNGGEEGASVPDDMKDVVTLGSDNATTSTDAIDEETNDPTNPSNIIDSLMTETDSNEKQFLKGLKDTGFGDFKSLAEFKKAIADKKVIFPEPEFNLKMAKLLYSLDMTLATAIDKHIQAPSDKDLNKKVSQRLSELLGPLYPDSKFKSGPDGLGIMIGNTYYVVECLSTDAFMSGAWVCKKDPNGTYSNDEGSGYQALQ